MPHHLIPPFFFALSDKGKRNNMNLIPPTTITDALFDDSSIPEPSSRESDGVTALTIVDSSCVEGDGTYDLIFTGGGAAVETATGTYTIVSNVITAVNLTYGGEYYKDTPTVATQTGDGSVTATWADNNYRGEWAGGTTYSVNAIVAVLADHKLYKSLANDNVGYTPGAAGNEAWWQDYGSTERWKPFDAVTGSQAEALQAGQTIQWELDPGPIDSVALLNLEATSVTVTMTDVGGAGDPVVWSPTVYSDGLYVTDVVKTDFPTSYLTPHLVIAITNTVETAKVGEIVVGEKETIGTMRYNPSVSIIDYSIKEIDDFGNYTVLERAYSKRLACETMIENTALDATYNTLADYRARPAVWVGSEDYASMIVYGFYKDFSIEIPYPNYSVCTLEIEGLV